MIAVRCSASSLLTCVSLVSLERSCDGKRSSSIFCTHSAMIFTKDDLLQYSTTQEPGFEPACQRYGSTSIQRARKHLGGSTSSMMSGN